MDDNEYTKSRENTGALENLIVTSIIALVNVNIIISSEKNDMLTSYSLSL